MTLFRLNNTDVIGLVRPSIDVHTLGMSAVASLLESCGYRVVVGNGKIASAVADLSNPKNADFLINWLIENGITLLGFSYRLDPRQAQLNFGKLYYIIKKKNMLSSNGGMLKKILFAGLPEACTMIQNEYKGEISVFIGDETPIETLTKMGVPAIKIPKSVIEGNEYDRHRWEFAKTLIEKERYLGIQPANRSGYQSFGTFSDTIIDRIKHAKANKQYPLMRAHIGPYNPNYSQSVQEFAAWVKQLAKDGFLDIVSIGTSQLTQSNFGEDWRDMPNGGGVPINSATEYRMLWEMGRPMLFRTYAGTKNVPDLAKIHELSLNISWHALSFWWFCQIDGRGPNTVFENLKQHFETLSFIAKSGKPFEPNIPHHFAFRGGDDLTYVISAYLSAKTAKIAGVKYLVLQNMLNTPKSTWGIQDLAKSRVMLRMVKSLEDKNFKVYLQPRAGLDYFSPDLHKAKIQLASVTALMDDIEASNDYSPDMIHVVSYSEASHLATPGIVKESIQITIDSLLAYRYLKKHRKMEDMSIKDDLLERTNNLMSDALKMISSMEKYIPNLYTPEGLYKAFASGFLTAPYLWEGRDEFKHAVNIHSTFWKGGIISIDENGLPLSVEKRIESARHNLENFKNI